MNKKMLTLLTVLMLSLAPMTALAAYDQNNPAKAQIKVVVSTLKTFTVTFNKAPSCDKMQFKGKPGESNINPEDQSTPPVSCQDADTAWAKVKNTGEVDSDFTGAIDTVIDKVTLKVKNEYDMTSDSKTLSTSPDYLPGGSPIVPDSFFDVFIKADFASDAAENTHTNVLTIKNYMPTLTSITVSGPASVRIPGTGTYTATGKDQMGNSMPLPSPASWSLQSGPAGVSIDPTTGVLTVAGDAAEGTAVVKATSDTVSGTLSVTIQY